MDITQLQRAIEAILFAAGERVIHRQGNVVVITGGEEPDEPSHAGRGP